MKLLYFAYCNTGLAGLFLCSCFSCSLCGYAQAHARAYTHMHAHTHTECLHSRVPRQISLQPLFVPWRAVIEISVNSSQFCCCCIVSYFQTKISFTSWLTYGQILFVLASLVGKKDRNLSINHCFIMPCKQPAFFDKRILGKFGDNRPKAITMACYLAIETDKIESRICEAKWGSKRQCFCSVLTRLVYSV